METKEYINNIKETLKILKLKANLFNIKSVSSRRYGSGYGSEVYNWCEVNFSGLTISAGDPHSGKFNTYLKYSYIHTTLTNIYPNASDFIFNNEKSQENTTEFVKQFYSHLENRIDEATAA